MPRPRTFDHDEALRLADGGMLQRDIAAKLGVSQKSISSALKRARARGGTTGIVFPNDPAPAVRPPAPAAPPSRVKCSHTTCQDEATQTLTNGTFLHHLALDRGGTRALEQHGAPVCLECFHVATGGFPCHQKRCTRVARVHGGFCTEHMPVMARPEPSAGEASPFPSGPFPGPAPRASSPREVPPEERRHLAHLANAAERRANGELPIGALRPATRPKDTTMRNGTPGATPAEREMSRLPSSIDERVAAVLEEQVATDVTDRVFRRQDFANPGTVEPAAPPADPIGLRAPTQRELDHQVEELLGHESEITEPAWDIPTDARPMSERTAETVRRLIPSSWLDDPQPSITRSKVDVSREGLDWRVQLTSAFVELDMVVPEWEAVERVLATFVRRAA